MAENKMLNSLDDFISLLCYVIMNFNNDSNLTNPELKPTCGFIILRYVNS